MEKRQIDNILNKEENAREVLNTILDISYDGIVVVDKNGFITMLSRAYADFLQVDREDVIGEHVTNVIENTRAHIVAKTGIAESAEIQKMRGKYTIATRIPIIQSGEVQGAVGKVLFRDIKDFNLLYNKIRKMETNIRKYNEELRQSNSAIYCFDNIIGDSSKLRKAKDLAKKAALTKSNVLLIGESGTGKELFAHAIHKASDRAYGNFVKVNCAAIPSELLESELFGYEKGSFTGAKKEGKMGKFELANGGTIFLDEIGDMPLHMQAKLLRVLQEKEVEKIGAIVSKCIDVRVIAATNRNLSNMVKEGSFRQDLYYRLNVVTINIPSLRERSNDIVTLTSYLLEKICKKLGKEVQGISSKAMDRLQSYSWYGNIRQLENVIERAVNVVEYDGKIKTEHLPQEITGKITEFSVKKLEDVMSKTEKETILNALRAFNGNKTQTAKALNISRTTLYEKMTKHGILF
ncbi:sigma 54-interacting transcriptional regulator [Clostridium botulinum]|uniref:Transcriptional regulator n=1 Tax=Clostridium botulinum C/D str. DC5 TaxID=1443128 RepID=A0A0A0IEM5_CLOBO|nr:sigma 54-interacting transcriptional regulator [Clostridium botulinum]KEI01721.1 transcriptional regulator [Clostridium botulinum C/D str. BKT75002]KEI07463.1 transcriptional regulator [Clostridium botulinum C/D str. BKT2873]KGM93246.1 transcriptional regulator [Clostridium botulinum D str. CCUG 7971]KGM99914.1 transcriptional regulator [Clostridium botulinum C/D str. DC5]KOC49381.1 transcriptional regulator [Clostridium botulinum]